MPPEPLHVKPEVVLSGGEQLGAAARELPDAPAPFSVLGADAISVKLAGLLPQIEGPILSGLPRVKAQASETAAGITSAARTYMRRDEELADMIRGTELGRSAEAGPGGGPSSANVAAASNVSGSSTGSAESGGGGRDQISQLAGVPMQIAGQAMGMAAAAPQAVVQGVQQVSHLAGAVGGTESDEAEDGRPEEAGGEPATGERAPVGPASPSDAGTATEL